MRNVAFDLVTTEEDKREKVGTKKKKDIQTTCAQGVAY